MMGALQGLLDPRCEPLPAQTAPPLDYGTEPDLPKKTAIIVCHGMGQQVRFQTLNDVVQLLRDEAFRQGGAVRDVVTRLVLFRDQQGVCTQQLARAELRVQNGYGDEREVHLYEAYWAPLTEGKVVIRDVLWFLLKAGVDGIIASLRGFRRLMFGQWVDLKKAPGTTLMFIFALAFIASLVAINSALSVVLAGNILRAGTGPAWPNPTLVNALIRDLAIAEVIGIPLAVIIGLVHGHRTWYLRRNRMSVRRWHMPKVLELFLAGWVWVALAATIGVALQIGIDIIAYRTAGDGQSVAVRQFILVAGLAFVMSYIIRAFLIQYLGDVVVYLSGHAVSKFNEIRDEIQTIGIKVGRAVYGLSQYDRCVVVGHSLGSVVAYDLYNRLLTEKDNTWNVQGRTPLLLTFGSPLDKTAFVFRAQGSKEADVREALAAAVQAIIANSANRPMQWVNIWSPRDWISGELHYYEKPTAPFVTNVPDPEATIPLIAHTQYWKNVELGQRLYSALSAWRQ